MRDAEQRDDAPVGSIFDSYLPGIRGFIADCRSGQRQVREFLVDASVDAAAGLPARRGGGFVLKADTLLELGGPADASCAVTLCTARQDAVTHGRVTLAGPDIGETPPGGLSFGQVIIVGGGPFDDLDYQRLLRCQGVSGLVEGSMAVSASARVWIRIGREAVDRGLRFATLGAALMRLIVSEVPRAAAVEVLFVTSSRTDVLALEALAAPVREAARAVTSRLWARRGFDLSDCGPGIHCGSCDDRAVCERMEKAAARLPPATRLPSATQ